MTPQPNPDDVAVSVPKYRRFRYIDDDATEYLIVPIADFEAIQQQLTAITEELEQMKSDYAESEICCKEWHGRWRKADQQLTAALAENESLNATVADAKIIMHRIREVCEIKTKPMMSYSGVRYEQRIDEWLQHPGGEQIIARLKELNAKVTPGLNYWESLAKERSTALAAQQEAERERDELRKSLLERMTAEELRSIEQYEACEFEEDQMLRMSPPVANILLRLLEEDESAARTAMREN